MRRPSAGALTLVRRGVPKGGERIGLLDLGRHRPALARAPPARPLPPRPRAAGGEVGLVGAVGVRSPHQRTPPAPGVFQKLPEVVLADAVQQFACPGANAPPASPVLALVRLAVQCSGIFCLLLQLKELRVWTDWERQ
eukprot:g18858.t1